MEFMFKILLFCSFVSITNAFGLHPAFENPSEWFETQANKLQRTLAIIYGIVCTIGWVHIVGWVIYWIYKL